MSSVINVYAPAGEIGWNEILVEDKQTRIMLDFGMSYAKYNRFYSGFRGSQGRA